MNSVCEQPGLHSIEQATAALAQLLARPIQSHRLPLHRAAGQVLACDVHARHDVPLWDNSAMDGYALNTADLPATGGRLPLAGCQAAGDAIRSLPAGHCLQIFTGAALPPGANCVIPQEDCQPDAGGVIFGVVRAGQNIRRQGEESRSGQLLLSKGTRLRAQEVGLLASQGYAEVEVSRALRIGIISSGNELRDPGSPLEPGQIFDSNGHLLASLLQGWGLEVHQYPRLRDDLTDTLQLLTRAAAEQDILISSGGVSVGEADYLKTAVAQLGRINLWRVAIQPGKPLAFGTVGSTPWIGLPGNPGASLITTLIIARPALLAAQGQAHTSAQVLPVTADFQWQKTSTRTRYLQARLQACDGRLTAQLHPQQSSAMLANCCWADGMVVIPAQHSIQQGDSVPFITYQALLSAH